MKKLLALILAVVMVLSTMSFTVFAEDADTATWPVNDDGLYYNTVDDGVAVVSVPEGETAYTGDISIPEMITVDGTEYSVVAIANNAFNNDYETVTSLVIPATVTSIGSAALANMDSLVTLTINGNVTSWGNKAVKNNDNLETVIFSEGATIIGGSQAFSDCPKLANLTIPSTATIIGGSAFARTALTELNIPASVDTIDGDAFKDIDTLKKVTFNSVPTSLGTTVFQMCDSLEEVVLPEGLISIPQGTFRYCTALKTIDFPESLTEIGNYSFQGCTSLESVNISKNITKLVTNAFNGCTSLKELTIEEGFAGTIGGYVFQGCTALESVVIPSTMETVGESMFNMCSNLKNVTLSEGVKTLNISAFASCSSLESLTLPDSLERMRHGSLANCTSLKELIIIGDNLPVIEHSNVLDGLREDLVVVYKGDDEFTGNWAALSDNVVEEKPVASITSGNVTTNYTNIDDAIANWTNGTTLTLLANVTLSDVIQLSSTEMHTLDLGIYVMTAASNKHAIQIMPNGRTNASYALDIKADANNPGGITASGKDCINSQGKSGLKDRPIIRIYGGIFNGSNVIKHSGSNGTNCPQFWIYGGEFNGSINTNRVMIQIYGGTFNKSFAISADSSAYTRIEGGKFVNLQNNYGSDLNADKWTFGTAKGVFDVNIYVDDDGYYVVTKSEIDANDIEADVAVDYSALPGTSRDATFKFSKLNEEKKLSYTSAEVALANNKSGSITLYTSSSTDLKPTGDLSIDVTDDNAHYDGNVELGSKGTFTIKLKATDEYKGIVTPYAGYVLVEEETIEDGIKTIKFSNSDNKDIAVASVGDYSFMTLQRAIDATNGNGTATLLRDTTEDVSVYSPAASTYDSGSVVTIDLNNFNLNGSVSVESGATVIIKNGNINATQSAVIVKNGGTAIIESGKFKTSAQELFAAEDGGSLVIKNGEFSCDPSQYADEGLEGVYRGEREYPYIIAAKKTSKIDVTLDKVEDGLYNIVLKPADEYEINEFVSAELTFEDHSETVGGGDMQYEILGIEGKTTAQRADDEGKQDQYIISIPNGDVNSEIRLSTDKTKDINEIVIGQVKFVGQGTLDLVVTDGKVVATWQGTNLGRYYQDTSLNLDGAVVNSSVAEKKRNVVIKVAYNHPLVKDVWKDDQITVTIKDGFGNGAEKYGVGDLTEGTATFPDVQLGRLTVTLEAPGFRKYVYETTLEEGTDALVLSFWNNVKRAEAYDGVVIDPKEEIETGKGFMAHNFLVGDIVMDYTVDEYDLAAVTSYYGTYGIQNVSKYLKYDLNRDGSIDIIDVHYVLHTLNN